MPGFVLLDRDGVINRRIVGGYVACQAGVGKGLMTAAGLEKLPHAPQATVPNLLVAAAFLLSEKG